MCSKALHNDFRAPVMVNSTRKHNKPHFSLGKTEVRSRRLWPAPCLPGSKIHHSCPLFAQNSVAKNVAFQPHSGQKAVAMCSKALHSDFHVPMMLNSPRNTLDFSFPFWENRGTAEVRLRVARLTWFQNPPAGSLARSK